MKRTAVSIAFMLSALTLASLPPAVRAQAAAAQPAPVVGTFDRSSIVLAFYRSPLWEAILADRRFELETVKAANDTARARELEKYGGESQEKAMQQLAGKAPIDNILAVMRPEFKDLTTRMKLSAIVDSATVDPKAATVDVTSLLMDWLKATSETRKMAADLRANPLAGK
jgi:hypothetical protein